MPVQPIRFKRVMVFVDGTNLFRRLEAANLGLTQDLAYLFTQQLSGRDLVRSYLYTTAPELDRARARHGDHVSDGLKVVLGDAIPTGDGNFKEKAVDAQLVADLVYHAALKNIDYALLVSVDTDFVRAAERVQDFGARTGLLAVCCDVPDRLRNACDEVIVVPEEVMIRKNYAKKL